MGKIKTKPEVLAPAGSLDSLKAAVAAGCDAVYMGGQRFGARAFADNPDESEMIRAIEYCHLHGVKLYMTVNTLLKDAELRGELREYLLPCYEAGLDAAIVQDVGVMRALHRWFPDLPLHASTQMSLTMGKGLGCLADTGVTRIVPARELTEQEIEQMRQDTDLELEVFVHGALCYSYSGRCLFSSMQGGRSGNRGRCAQPCRMQYRLHGMDGYYLSTRELCNLPYLDRLIEAGVDSFKIEGRMKQPEYTAFVTAVYCKYIDLYVSLGRDAYQRWRQSHQAEWEEDLLRLAELYNREGFTHGYLAGQAGVSPKQAGASRRQTIPGQEKREASMLSRLRPRHGGVRVGTVKSVGEREVIYRLERDTAPQDVLEFRRDKTGQTVYEYTVGTGQKAGEMVRAHYQKGHRPAAGDGVYRTRHWRLLNEIRQKYLEPRQALAVTGVLTAEPGGRCVLTVSRLGCLAVAEGEAQPALKQPTTEESVRRAVTQTGDSPFFFSELEIRLSGEVFLPVGMLKKLRRAALQQLEQALLQVCRRDARSDLAQERRKTAAVSIQNDMTGCSSGRAATEQEIDLPEPPAGNGVCSAAVMTLGQLASVLEAPEVAEVILRMDQMSDRQLRQGAKLVRASGRRLLLGMPAIWRTADWSYYAREAEQGTGIFCEIPADGYLIQNMESFAFLQEVLGVSPSSIRTDASLYVMNREAVDWWHAQGVRQMTAPWELTGTEWEALHAKECMQWIVYGHIPLMVSAQCVAGNTEHCRAEDAGRNGQTMFTDVKKREFIAVNYCRYCYNIIYQGRPFSILRHREDLLRAGCASWRYDFTVETEAQVREILAGREPEKTESGHYRQGVW